MKFYFDTCGPVYLHMPQYLKETSYKNPDSFTDGMWQRGLKTDQITFDYIHADKQRSAGFNLFMKGQRGSQTKCFASYPFEEETKGWPAEKPLFVDVGGGSGHQTAAFKKEYPNLPGRVILEDLPEPVEDAKDVVPADVERIAHDFFKPQPIKGIYNNSYNEPSSRFSLRLPSPFDADSWLPLTNLHFSHSLNLVCEKTIQTKIV